jgi:hypothetical protein
MRLVAFVKEEEVPTEKVSLTLKWIHFEGLFFPQSKKIKKGFQTIKHGTIDSAKILQIWYLNITNINCCNVQQIKENKFSVTLFW